MTTKFSRVEIEGHSWDNILTMHISGKLTKEDYDVFLPELERMINQHSGVRLIVVLEDFHGWTTAAAWEDGKFGLRHYSDIDRMAIVGENRWEQGMTLLLKPFTKAKVKYFDISELDAANVWITDDK